MCSEPGWDIGLGGWCPAWGSWGCALLHTQGCWRLLQDVAMSSRAIPGRVDPGSYWQEPAALTPDKQPGGHQHIPDRSLAAARAQGFLFIPVPRRGTVGRVGSGVSQELAASQARGFLQGRLWGPSPVSMSRGGGLCLGTSAASLAQG